MASKVWKIFIGFAILLAIVGLILLIVGKKNEVVEKKEEALTVVDAGGSGTRLTVYKMFLGKFEQFTVKCEGKGLGNWEASQYPALEAKLIACYKKGHEYLPEESSNTPIWFGATAGMRVLRIRDSVRYDQIWTMVNRTLKTTDYDVRWSNVFPGKYEARFAWIAANILRGTAKTGDFVGIAETGSSSIQMAFAVDGAPAPDKHVDEVNLFNKKVSLYEYSYLCYGESEGLRRTHAQLISNSKFNNSIEDPCSNQGYEWSRSPDYLWSVPCVKGDKAVEMFGSSIAGPANDTSTYKLTGSSKPQVCLDLLRTMIPTNCTKNNPCGLDDISQPKVRDKYLALSSFYYSTDYMGLPYNGNGEEYWSKTVELCNTTYDKLSPKYPDSPEKFKRKQCFDSIFTYFLLADGFKFDKGNWDIEYTKKINGKGVQWTLGVAYQFRDQAFTHMVGVVQSHYRTMFIVGIVLLVVAIVVFIVSLICIKRVSDYEEIEVTTGK